MKSETSLLSNTRNIKTENRNDGVLRELIRNKTLYLMAVPALVLLIIFSYLPMIGSLIAFKDYNFSNGLIGIFTSPFIKPFYKNFEFFFTSGFAWRVTRNTLLLNGVFIVTGIIFPVGFAVMLNEVRSGPFKKIVQSLTFLPYFISWIVLSVFVYNVLNYDGGVINNILVGIGLEKYDFYFNPNIWPLIMTLINLWKSVGYGIILYLAVIGSFDTSLYEASGIDGATKLKQLFYITLPLLRPTILMLTLLNIGRIMNADFGMFYSIVGNNAQLYPTVDVIDTFVYRALRQTSDIGMSSAAAFFQSTLSLVIVLISNKLVKRYQEDAALF